MTGRWRITAPLKGGSGRLEAGALDGQVIPPGESVEVVPVAEVERLREQVEDAQRCAVCGTGQLHRKLTDDEELVAKRIFDAGAAEDRAWAEVERLREAGGRAYECLTRLDTLGPDVTETAVEAARMILTGFLTTAYSPPSDITERDT